VVKVTKTVKLNILPLTNRKYNQLLKLEEQYLKSIKHLSETIYWWDGFTDVPLTRFNLHIFEYKHVKEFSNMQSQIVEDTIKDCFASWQNDGVAQSASISYNIPRSADFRVTNRKNPIISIATFKGEKRMGLPIAQDGAWKRFIDFLRKGWKTTAFRLKRVGDKWQIFVSIYRDITLDNKYDAVIGVDVGSRTLATISILDKNGRTVKQLYFGRDIWDKQREINIRRSKLQKIRDTANVDGRYKAIKKLKMMKKVESNFVKTRVYEVAHKIVDLAKEYNAVIAIENLNGLKDSRLHRKANRRIKRLPYNLFRVALEQVAWVNRIEVTVVNATYTSQRCSKCGKIHKTSSVVFKCPHCGFIVNRDRNASVNIAHVAGIFFNTFTTTQYNMGDALVNWHVWKDDGVLNACWQQHVQTSDFKPPIEIGVVD